MSTNPPTGPLHVKILSIITMLTPPNCMECSTQEVQVNLLEDGTKLSVRGLASHLGNLRARGLIKSRLYAQRHLWKLTGEGKRWLKVQLGKTTTRRSA